MTVLDLRYPRIAGVTGSGAEAGVESMLAWGLDNVAVLFTATSEPAVSLRTTERCVVAGTLRSLRPVPSADGWLRPYVSEADVALTTMHDRLILSAEVRSGAGGADQSDKFRADLLPVDELLNDVVEAGQLANVDSVHLRGNDAISRVAVAATGFESEMPSVAARSFLQAISDDIANLDSPGAGSSWAAMHAFALVREQLQHRFPSEREGTYALGHNYGKLSFVRGPDALNSTMSLQRFKPSEWLQLSVDVFQGATDAGCSVEDELQLAQMGPALAQIGRRAIERVDVGVVVRR